MQPEIVWTQTDEAPGLATYSLFPIIQAFLKASDIQVSLRDLSLAGRILAQFPDVLNETQRTEDDLKMLGDLCLQPEANIIKLPNISASIPQLKEAIAELQSQGYALPNYPENPTTSDEKETQARYAKVLGSAVNPVLREGNSDRRAPLSVKNFARKHPPRVGTWTKDVNAKVAHMDGGDFYANEQSITLEAQDSLSIVLVEKNGERRTLKDKIATQKGEVVDASFMQVSALRAFYSKSIEEAKNKNLLWSLHVKATMMKVSDPVLFGHAVSVYFEEVFKKHAECFKTLGIQPNQGLGDVFAKLQALDAKTREAIEADFQNALTTRPALAMVDSAKGITNLHAPNDIIVDASIPAVIRDSGCMWNRDGKLQETLAVIPDRSYAMMYAAVFDDCRKHGALDPVTMGSVPNIGLMAQQAEEYGSHPTTFIIPADGVVHVINHEGKTLLQHTVSTGDIWRMCRTRDVAIADWVRLAVERAKITRTPTVFWLDSARAHDRELIKKVKAYLPQHDPNGLDIFIFAPVEAMRFSLERIRQGLDTISVTGNVLRDYLTDIFPILELGTSAKMLSIVPLLAGGGLFETGAGGSAPKHVEQFLQENYLRWDSFGEFSALGASLEHVANRFQSRKAEVLAKTLDQAISKFLDENKSPARKVGSIDNRGSHFYLALYWAAALAAQTESPELQTKFAAFAQSLAKEEAKINAELISVQGKPVDIGGYYHPEPQRTQAAMCPSATFNTLLKAFAA